MRIWAKFLILLVAIEFLSRQLFATGSGEKTSHFKEQCELAMRPFYSEALMTAAEHWPTIPIGLLEENAIEIFGKLGEQQQNQAFSILKGANSDYRFIRDKDRLVPFIISNGNPTSGETSNGAPDYRLFISGHALYYPLIGLFALQIPAILVTLVNSENRSTPLTLDERKESFRVIFDKARAFVHSDDIELSTLSQVENSLLGYTSAMVNGAQRTGGINIEKGTLPRPEFPHIFDPEKVARLIRSDKRNAQFLGEYFALVMRRHYIKLVLASQSQDEAQFWKVFDDIYGETYSQGE